MLYLVEFQMPFFCQIHLGQVVFLCLPFLNGLSYKVAVALDRKIIGSRLRIPHDLINFIEISSLYSSYDLFCTSFYARFDSVVKTPQRKAFILSRNFFHVPSVNVAIKSQRPCNPTTKTKPYCKAK